MVVAFPVGIYSALRQYSAIDYAATLTAFLGMATPNFLLALVLMYLGYEWFGIAVGGLFSTVCRCPLVLCQGPRLTWTPLDTGRRDWRRRNGRLNAHNAGKPVGRVGKTLCYNGHSKGLSPIRLVIKYPLRIAINPFISTVGWMLPGLISGSAITSVVLSLPTTGPLLLESLMNQDMYLAGSFLLMLSALTVSGPLFPIFCWL